VADLGFGVLGPLEVWRGGRRVAVPGGRRRSVLAALLARAGNPVTVDALVEAAWSDGLPADPRAALYTVVSRLRSLLGDDALSAGPAGYQLDVPADAVDALRFERLCREAGAAGPEQAAVLLDEGLGLWRGPAYAEFADRDFAGTEARRLELLRADAWEERAQVALDLGDPEGGVRRLEGLLAEYPFREHAVGLLMTALHQAGRTGDALARYREHRRRMAGELGLGPSPALGELEARILGQGGPPRPAGDPGGVPAWLDTSAAFLGRERELASLVETTAGSKVVTVTGTGGVGKTRLVAEALPVLAARIGLPVVVVELAAVGRGDVAAAVADALGLGRGEAGRAVLVGRLRADPAIVVLDNCEHLLAEVASLADLLARRCPDVRVVLTSRHRLGLPAEQVLPVPPLPGPSVGDPPDRARASAAVALLADRVQRARPAFTVTPQNLPAIAGICRRLDGLPLALELAASRVAALGAHAVRDGLERDPALLDEAASGRRPLRALVDWSCNLLTSGQQDLFAALSVFPGDFDLAAAQRVARGLQRPGPAAAVAGMLAELVDSCLVSARQTTDGPRYRLLTVVRTQAGRRLAGSGRTDLARRAHAAWAAELTGQAARDWTGPGAAAALRRLQRGQADIMAALRWALRTGALDLAASIAGAVQQCPHWTPRPELSDLIIKAGEHCRRHDGSLANLGVAAAGVALALRGDLERSVALGKAATRSASTPAERYLAHLALGVAAVYGGDHEDSRRHWQAIAGLQDLPLALRADAHSGLALLARYAGNLALARDEGRLAVMLAETAGSAPVHAFALYAAGEAAVAEPDQGIAVLTEAAGEAAAIGAGQVSQVARVALFAALVRTGHHDRAAPLAAALLHDVRRAGAWPQLWTTLRILAELQAATGHPHEAALLLGAADAHPSAPPATGDDVRRYASLREALRTRLGDRISDRIRAAARGASREQIADRAAALLGGPATTAPP
jgi:predicted ATPase/DNA-binding SARP family transcriptional activator